MVGTRLRTASAPGASPTSRPHRSRRGPARWGGVRLPWALRTAERTNWDGRLGPSVGRCSPTAARKMQRGLDARGSGPISEGARISARARLRRCPARPRAAVDRPRPRRPRKPLKVRLCCPGLSGSVLAADISLTSRQRPRVRRAETGPATCTSSAAGAGFEPATCLAYEDNSTPSLIATSPEQFGPGPSSAMALDLLPDMNRFEGEPEAGFDRERFDEPTCRAAGKVARSPLVLSSGPNP